MDSQEVQFYEWNMTEVDNLPMVVDRGIMLDSIIPEKFQVDCGVAKFISQSTKKKITSGRVEKIDKLPDFNIEPLCYFDESRVSKLPAFLKWILEGEDEDVLNLTMDREKVIREKLCVPKFASDFIQSSIEKRAKFSTAQSVVTRVTQNEIGNFQIQQELCLSAPTQIANRYGEIWAVQIEVGELKAHEEISSDLLSLPFYKQDKVTYISRRDTASDFEIETPILSRSNLSNCLDNDKQKRWSCDMELDHLIRPSERFEYRESVLMEDLTQESLLKIKMPYIPKTSMRLNDEKKRIRQLYNHKWSIPKVKLAGMNWKPFGKLSKNKILGEPLDTRELYLPFPYNFRVTRIKADDLEYRSDEREKNSLDVNVASPDTTALTEIDNETTKSAYTSPLNESLESSITTKGKTSKDISVQEDQLREIFYNTLPMSMGESDLEEIHPETPAGDRPAKFRHTPPSSLKRSNQSIAMIESLIASKKQKIAKSNFVLGENEFPLLDALNYSTNIFTTQQSIEKQKSIEVQKNSTNNTVLGAVFIDGLHTTAIPETPSPMKDIILGKLEGANMYRQLAVSNSFVNRHTKLYESLQRYADNHDNHLCIYEIQNEPSTHVFDIFVSETCGVLLLSPLQAYQIDVTTHELKIFKTIEEMVIHVQSIIIVIPTDNQSDDKLTEFDKRCEQVGIKTVFCDKSITSMGSCLCRLIEKYGAVIEINDYHGPQFSDEHIFLFNCGIINPILVSTILSMTTLDEFVRLDYHCREEAFRDIIPQGLLNHLNAIFSNPNVIEGGEEFLSSAP